MTLRSFQSSTNQESRARTFASKTKIHATPYCENRIRGLHSNLYEGFGESHAFVQDIDENSPRQLCAVVCVCEFPSRFRIR